MRQDKPLRLPQLIDSPYFVPVCFAVYIGLRFAVIVWVPIEQHSDELWYYNRAVALAAGQGYSEHHVLTAYWPVGWPALLGIVFWFTGASPVVGQMVNLVCSAAIFVLTLHLGAVLFRDKLVGRLSVLILTVYPNQIAYVPILGTEVFYTALLLLAVDLTVAGGGWRRPAAGGVTFGIATLTKAQTLFIPAVLLAGWWAAGGRSGRSFSRLGRAAAVYAAMAVVILPWTARNYHVFGKIIPVSTNGGLTLLTGNNPSAEGDFTPNDPLVAEVPHGVAHQVEADHIATRLALTWVRRHPAAAAALIPKKIWRLWAPDGEAEWSYQAGYKHYIQYAAVFRTIRIANQAYYVGLMLLFLLSIFHWLKGAPIPSPEWTTGYLLVIYTTLISIVFSGQSRFHFAMVPWIAMYAAWAIVQSIGVTRLAPRAPA